MDIGADGRLTRPGRAVGAAVPDRLWVPAVGALAIALLFVAALLVRADGDVSLLVHAAPPHTAADAAPASLTVQGEDDGFDGQFFYRLGVDPWTTDEVVAGITNDLPALRNARWGYGALAWLTSGGDADLVPWALVGLNVAAMAAVGAIGGGLARSAGRHAAWGLLFALWPGFAYSLSMDTSELVASAFALGGLLALRHARWVPAALLFSAAVITRDTTAVVPAGVALAAAWTWLRSGPAVEQAPTMSEQRTDPLAPRPSGRGAAIGPLAAGVAPLVLFGVWQLVQRARFGDLPLTSSGDNNLSVPLGGLVDQLRESVPPGSGEELFRLLCIAGLVALITAAAVTAWRPGHRARPRLLHREATLLGERVAWLLAVAVVVVLNAYLWSGATAFMRAATEAGLLSTLLVLGARGRHADRLLAAAGLGLGGLWLLTAVAQLSKLA